MPQQYINLRRKVVSKTIHSHPMNLYLTLNLLKFFITCDQFSLIFFRQRSGEAVGVGHAMFCFEAGGEAGEIPVGIDKLDAKVFEVRNSAFRFSFGYLSRQD